MYKTENYKGFKISFIRYKTHPLANFYYVMPSIDGLTPIKELGNIYKFGALINAKKYIDIYIQEGREIRDRPLIEITKKTKEKCIDCNSQMEIARMTLPEYITRKNRFNTGI